MPDLVINSGPIIALRAAVESLQFLNELYEKILMPFEVVRELEAGIPTARSVCICETLKEQAIAAVVSE